MGKDHVGVSEVRLRIPHNLPFDDIVKLLESTLTIPPVGSFAGCAPCGTLVDRIVLEDPVYRELRAQRTAFAPQVERVGQDGG